MRKINLLIIAMMLLAVMPMVLGATTLTSPVASGNYSGTMTLTATTAINSSTGSYNVTFYYNASGGATGTKLVTVSNTSGAQNTFTSASYSITSLTDATTYNFTAYADNGTTNEWSAGVKGITKDSTSPACSLVKKYTRPPYKGIQQLTWTSSDALSLISTVTTIDRPQTGSDMTYTDANRDLTLISTDTPYFGDWTATTVATDRSGNTANCTETWKSYLPDGDIEEAQAQAETQAQTQSDMKGLFIVVIIGVLAFLFLKDK